MSLFSELKRRNVIRVATAYVVASWLIIQVVETILPAYGMGEAAIRLVVSVLAIAFIPILVFSWVFEITPEGLRREVDVIREHSITRFTGEQLDRIIMVLLAVALGYFGFDKFILDPARDAELVAETAQQVRSDVLVKSYGEKSIAVLPFVNMSSDPEQEYFSDGVSEELLNLLSKIPGLRVISRSSAFSYKGKDIDIPAIAEQLNVAHVLEGSVRKDGNRVRITAQLIEARSDTHLWSETYDRNLENIFAVQNEISVAIIAALKGPLGLKAYAAPRVSAPANTEAHDAYLRGRYLVAQRTRASIEGAIVEFEKAVTIDPDYALAHAELANAFLLLNTYDGLTITEAVASATPHVNRAMVLDANLAEAHAAKGFLLWKQGPKEEVLAAFNEAIRINPNDSVVYSWKANLLNDMGRYAEAIPLRETAIRLDPISILANFLLVNSLRRTNHLDDAARELEKLASMAPSHSAYLRGELASVGGKWASLALGYLDGLRITPEAAYGLPIPSSFALIGLEQEALTVHKTLKTTNLRDMVFTRQILGKPMDAVAIAEKYLVEDPLNAGLRGDLGLALAASGDYTHARSLLEELWQRNNKRVTFGTGTAFTFWADHAAALIAVRREAGETAGVEELLAALRDNVRRYREAGIIWSGTFTNGSVVDYEEGLADFLSGEREKGLGLIAKAAVDGSFILPNQAYLQTLYDDPGFAPIMAGQRDRQARERNRFLSIVCTDNPYAAVWQPAEGTCEQFLAEGED